MQLISWNVNGLRAAHKKGFLEWFTATQPDVLCLQETKAWREQLPAALTDVDGYTLALSEAERKGYSGVALYTKQEPLRIEHGFGIERFDREGRTIVAEYDTFTLYAIYFPNGKMSPERLQYKLDFYDAFLAHANERRKNGKGVIFCGDVNTAHKEIDLFHPKENAAVSGFLPVERAWIDRVVENGYSDTLRLFNDQPHQYTWWDLKSRARERNVGWRLDYFFASSELRDAVKNAFIMADVYGSDHCPVGITLDV